MNHHHLLYEKVVDDMWIPVCLPLKGSELSGVVMFRNHTVEELHDKFLELLDDGLLKTTGEYKWVQIELVSISA